MNVDKDYLESLDNLEKILNLDNAEETDKILDNMYKIKPVRLKWFILKAKVTKLLGKDTSDIQKTLFKKYNILYNNDKLETVADCLMDLTDDNVEKARLLYHINLKNNPENTDGIVYEKKNEYNWLIEKYINDIISQQEFETLISNCYIRGDHTQYILFNVVYEKTYDKPLDIANWILETPNAEINIERLREAKNKNYIVIEDEKDTFNCKAVIKALNFLGNKVFYLDTPLDIDMPNKITIDKTLPVSLENAVQANDCIIIHPVRLFYKGEAYGDNIDYLVDYINNDLADDKLNMIFSSGFTAEKLCGSDRLKKSSDRISLYKADYFEANLNICRSGDYLSYISEIYKYDVHESVNRNAECDFSIVVPVSNNVDTFKHTLQTCLNLRYEGSYEIVVSDNSINGNTVVYDYIKEIDDDRIKYYKTPRALPLTKSFEFAFLHARGEFIFSIGADDGVLPWSLDILKNVLDKIPDKEVFLWDRGFYAWPGFNGGQENQFIIPRMYRKNNVNVSIRSGIEMLIDVINNPSLIYGLPLLYINSGFRRSYFKTLISKSGRMWDGHSQDIYMGILNVCINQEIVWIEYPLTIAGMSGHSIGKSANTATGVITDKHPSYMNFITISSEERNIPCIGHDVQNIYCAVLRMISRGIIPRNFINKITGELAVYERQMQLVNKKNEMFEEYIDWYLECMKKADINLFNSYMEEWRDKIYLPIEFQDEEENTNYFRIYNIGFSESGSLTLDGSDFNVKNISEASELFGKITGI